MHLQALQGEVIFPGLSLVGDEHEDDNDKEEASTGGNADNGRKGQQAVRHDVDRTGGDVETTYLNLRGAKNTHIMTLNLKSMVLNRSSEAKCRERKHDFLLPTLTTIDIQPSTSQVAKILPKHR